MTSAFAWPSPAEAAASLDDVIDVVATPLDLESKAVSAMEATLSAAERQTARRFRLDLYRRRFIVARAQLRQLLAARLGTHPEFVQLEYGSQGKLALVQRRASMDLRFSISRSENLAVYAFSNGREIGIDVEAIRWVHDAEQIAAQCFSHRENLAYLALDPRDRLLGFLNCWTRREAFTKALGESRYCALDDFDVSLAPDEPAKILRVENTLGEYCRWALYSFTPISGFVAALVAESRCGVAKPGLRIYRGGLSWPALFPEEAQPPLAIEAAEVGVTAFESADDIRVARMD